jgi:nicotinate phosphoribosyltransferase
MDLPFSTDRSLPLAEGFLFVDLYELTMAQLYFRVGWADRHAQFDHFFRHYPDYGAHKAGFCVNAGLATLLDWMERARCGEREIEVLRGLKGGGGESLFGDDFLAWLRGNGTFEALTVRAVPEGRVVHPDAPLTIVRGPLPQAQILESALLNILNYQVLIATRAARLKEAGEGRPVIEFGMRRGQGTGVNAGARAALIGGADFTSNTGISAELGFPPKGTHAHSLVQAFLALGHDELDAFRAYADLYPDDCLLVVDTIDTLGSGVPNAIRVFEELRRRGHEPVGIRLDSGDLAYLSLRAARMLDQAGFPEAAIVLSNQLDEPTLAQILAQIEDEAAANGVDAVRVIGRLTYGIGTRLIVSQGDAALDGVYKLVAVREGDAWLPAIKMSETPAKILNPGEKDVWRLYDRRGKATADLITVAGEDPRADDPLRLHHATLMGVSRALPQREIVEMERLLVEVVREGKRVGDAGIAAAEPVASAPSASPPSPDEARREIERLRARRQADVDRLDAGVKRLVNPHTYHVSLSDRLWGVKQELAKQRS